MNRTGELYQYEYDGANRLIRATYLIGCEDNFTYEGQGTAVGTTRTPARGT